MYVMILAQAHLYFNSQPHKEADCINQSGIWTVHIFQLTASQGG